MHIRITIGKILAFLIELTYSFIKNPGIYLNKDSSNLELSEEDELLKDPIGVMLTVTSVFFVVILIYVFIKI